MKKKSISLIIIIYILINIASIAYAGDISDIFRGGSNFLNAGTQGAGGIRQEKIQEVSDSFYNVFLVVGICTAVVVIGILGIKFMIGSVEEKSQTKELLVPFIIGCVVIFGSFAIWKIVVVIGNRLIVS